ncbi:uncharacterized protein PG986_011277 [Apiospora aurea]|uniref:Uncharacterized protein n=1 Tax=Apiospora aurea TaxID=335848 RepID=A0ABR1Q4N6_9PEZI
MPANSYQESESRDLLMSLATIEPHPCDCGDCSDCDSDVEMIYLRGVGPDETLAQLSELPKCSTRDVAVSRASDVRSSTFNTSGGSTVGSRQSIAVSNSSNNSVEATVDGPSGRLLAYPTSSVATSHGPRGSRGMPHLALSCTGSSSSHRGNNTLSGLNGPRGSARSSRDTETPFGPSDSHSYPNHQSHCPGCNCIGRRRFPSGNSPNSYASSSSRPNASSRLTPGVREPLPDRDVLLWDAIRGTDESD